MHLDDGAVDRHRFNLYADDLLLLEGRKDSVQHPGLGPAIHPRVDRMPVTEAPGQTPPFATVLGHIQNRVQYLKIGDAYVPALPRKAGLDPAILSLCDSHHPIYTTSRDSVNRP